MPRLEDRLLKSVVYLFRTPAGAEDGAPGGSGFLVGVPTRVQGQVYVFAVTNRHVAERCPIIRVAGPPLDGRMFTREWGREDHLGWVSHAGDDLAVTPIGFAPADCRDYRFDYVPREWFVTPENFTEASDDYYAPEPRTWPFGTGDEVVMVGRYIGYDGAHENRPAARFGNIAIQPPVPIPHPFGIDQLSFVVECRSVSGFSGSPVFVYRSAAGWGGGRAPIGSTADPQPQGTYKATLPRLLGIDWGNLDRTDHNNYVIDWAEDDQPRQPSGMLVAVPAWHLAQLLDSKEVDKLKRADEAEVARRAKGVSLDFEPADPSEFVQFQALTRRLLAVPKKELDDERGKS